MTTPTGAYTVPKIKDRSVGVVITVQLTATNKATSAATTISTMDRIDMCNSLR